MQPELHVLTDKDQVTYKAVFPATRKGDEPKVYQETVSLEDHKQMLVQLQIITREDFFHRFVEICEYYLAKEQYVEFEEVPS